MTQTKHELRKGWGGGLGEIKNQSSIFAVSATVHFYTAIVDRFLTFAVSNKTYSTHMSIELTL